MSYIEKTIKSVVENKLCNSCGACFAVCHMDAIYFEETIGGHIFPLVNELKCTTCGRCLSVCPGIHFGKTLSKKMPEDPFRGNAIGSYVGKATNKEIYGNSQSGGVVSALALYMLESGQADAVMTVVMEWGNPPRAKAHLAKNRKDIIAAQKSKYCPVPILQLLKEVEKEDLKRVVLVGTSCQIHGLINIRDVLPRLGSRVVLTIGLFCTHVMTCAAIDHLISETELNDYDGDKHLDYRDKACGGYPGQVHIRSSDGRSKVLPTIRRGRIKHHYIPARCWICFDGLNIFSDIAVGDPWHLEGVDRENGDSVAVTRTKKGQELVLEALKNNVVSLKNVHYKDVADGQSVERMRNWWRGYIQAWKNLEAPYPDFTQKVLKKANIEKNVKSHTLTIKKILSIDDFDTREKVLQAIEFDARKKEKFYNRLRLFAKVKYKKILDKIRTK